MPTSVFSVHGVQAVLCSHALKEALNVMGGMMVAGLAGGARESVRLGGGNRWEAAVRCKSHYRPFREDTEHSKTRAPPSLLTILKTCGSLALVIW